MLPLPQTTENDATDGKGSMHALETSVMDWAHQVQKELKASSSTPLDEGSNPGPTVEIEFWQARAANLLGISEQLHGPKISKIGKTLKENNSRYFSAFESIVEDVTLGTLSIIFLGGMMLHVH
jgi:dynein heavy chain